MPTLIQVKGCWFFRELQGVYDCGLCIGRKTRGFPEGDGIRMMKEGGPLACTRGSDRPSLTVGVRIKTTPSRWSGPEQSPTKAQQILSVSACSLACRDYIPDVPASGRAAQGAWCRGAGLRRELHHE